MGLKPRTYEAYCFNQAVAYFGNWVEYQLDKLEKPSKDSLKLQEARKKRLQAILNTKDGVEKTTKKSQGQFMDPAKFFSTN